MGLERRVASKLTLSPVLGPLAGCVCRKRKAVSGETPAAPDVKRRRKGNNDKQQLLRVSLLVCGLRYVCGGCGSRSKERQCGR